MEYHKVNGPYKYESIISVTKHFTLWKARHTKLNYFVAVKEVPKSHSHNKQKSLEEKMFSICNHPNIIRLYQTIKDESNVYFIEEFLDHGTLNHYISKHNNLSEAECQYLFSQIIYAIQYLHKEIGVYHGDISADSFGFTNGYNTLKINDLGYANYINSDKTIAKYPIPHYMSPEEINCIDKPTETDVWHCGILLYYMLTGSYPFDDDQESSLLHSIIHMKPILPMNASPLLKDLLSRMLNKDPDERIKIDEIVNHPWFLRMPKYVPNEKISIKKDIIKVLEAKGYQKSVVTNDLKQKMFTENSAAYYIALSQGDYGEESESTSSFSNGTLPEKEKVMTKSRTMVFKFDQPLKIRQMTPGHAVSLVPSHSKRRASYHLN